jgi:hypothetical protein
MGFCDSVSTGAAIRNFTDHELSDMKSKLAACRNSAPKTGAVNPPPPAITNLMNKQQLIDLLNKWKVTIPANATDAQLLELVTNYVPIATAPPATPPADPKIIDLQNQITRLTEADNAAKKLRITNAIEKFIADDKLPAAGKDKYVARAMADETVLEEYNLLPARPPGVDPVGPNSIELTGTSFEDIQKFVLKNSATGPFIGAAGAGRMIDSRECREMSNRARKIANILAKPENRAKIMEMWNTNTIDAGLQRQIILSDMLRAFSTKLLPLSAFCKTFLNVPLEGTDKVDVPYFPLQTVASNDWVAGTGYANVGNTTQNTREVTVNKRKYQQMQFTSQELRRQPYQNWQQLGQMNAEKLGVDVNADVLSIVTISNYGAAVKTTVASAFSGDDLADLYGSATSLNWPTTGRSLVLTHPYKVALLKDPGFKYALNFGDNDPIRKAEIKSAYGFEDIYVIPTANLPTNAQNLVGWINHLSAALVATAPIMPAPAVRALMVQYDLVVDPINGIALEYKLFGDLVKDATNEIVECNYGYTAGVQSALARITSA